MCHIREMKEEEYYLLEEFLYQAVFQEDENNLLPKDIIKNPALQIYIKNFGTEKSDYCLCAEESGNIVGEESGNIVGAVWARCINGFGNIDKYTPELAISLNKDYRGKGIGKKLMKSMLNLLKEKKYKKVSLSVQKNNYAAKLYLNLGFKIVKENNEEYIMEYCF